jgi:hypothetical protein
MITLREKVVSVAKWYEKQITVNRKIDASATVKRPELEDKSFNHESYA